MDIYIQLCKKNAYSYIIYINYTKMVGMMNLHNFLLIYFFIKTIQIFALHKLGHILIDNIEN